MIARQSELGHLLHVMHRFAETSQLLFNEQKALAEELKQIPMLSEEDLQQKLHIQQYQSSSNSNANTNSNSNSNSSSYSHTIGIRFFNPQLLHDLEKIEQPNMKKLLYYKALVKRAEDSNVELNECFYVLENGIYVLWATWQFASPQNVLSFNLSSESVLSSSSSSALKSSSANDGVMGRNPYAFQNNQQKEVALAYRENVYPLLERLELLYEQQQQAIKSSSSSSSAISSSNVSSSSFGGGMGVSGGRQTYIRQLLHALRQAQLE